MVVVVVLMVLDVVLVVEHVVVVSIEMQHEFIMIVLF